MSRFHTVEVGDEVRSYDFPSDATCYVEGTVERIVPAGSEAVAFGCDRYAIRVKRMVWEGEHIAVPTDDPYVHPPVNGTPSMIEDANGVIRISELPPEQRSVPSAVPAPADPLYEHVVYPTATSAASEGDLYEALTGHRSQPIDEAEAARKRPPTSPRKK